MRAFLQRLVRRLPLRVRWALRTIPGTAAAAAALTPKPSGPEPAPGMLRPIVCLPTWLQWDVMPQRPQALMVALAAAGHEVFFVDPREHGARVDRGVQIVPSLRPVPARHALVYAHYAPTADLVRWFDHPVLVFDVLDDLAMYAGQEAGLPSSLRVETHFPTALASAQVVIASSGVLADSVRARRPDVVLVENGVDVALFGRAWERPADLPAGRPIVGYHGAIDRWFDVDLLAAVADRCPGFSFVLVGPVAPSMREPIDRLADRPNVVVLGERPGADIAAYVAAFSVGAVWFRVDEVTRAVSPLKVFECLAAGVPVVSTPLPAVLGLYGVTPAASPDDFVAAIEAASGVERSALRSAAATAAWQVRIDPLLRRLDEAGLRSVPG